MLMTLFFHAVLMAAAVVLSYQLYICCKLFWDTEWMFAGCSGATYSFFSAFLRSTSLYFRAHVANVKLGHSEVVCTLFLSSKSPSRCKYSSILISISLSFILFSTFLRLLFICDQRVSVWSLWCW